MKVIVVTGTPGTGKTTVSKRLAKEKGYDYLDVHEFIKNNRLHDSYDRSKRCYVIDTKILKNALIKEISRLKKEKPKGIVIDSLLSHYLPKRYVDQCIVTKCNLKTLEKRLKKRKYNPQKIRENLDSEIFDICYNEAKDLGHKVKVIDTSN